MNYSLLLFMIHGVMVLNHGMLANSWRHSISAKTVLNSYYISHVSKNERSVRTVFSFFHLLRHLCIQWIAEFAHRVLQINSTVAFVLLVNFSLRKHAWDSVYSWGKWKRSHPFELQQTQLLINSFFYQHKLFVLWTTMRSCWYTTIAGLGLKALLLRVGDGFVANQWGQNFTLSSFLCFYTTAWAALHHDPDTSGINMDR